jgi:hypothetical protein
VTFIITVKHLVILKLGRDVSVTPYQAVFIGGEKHFSLSGSFHWRGKTFFLNTTYFINIDFML